MEKKKAMSWFWSAHAITLSTCIRSIKTGPWINIQLPFSINTFNDTQLNYLTVIYLQ